MRQAKKMEISSSVSTISIFFVQVVSNNLETLSRFLSKVHDS